MSRRNSTALDHYVNYFMSEFNEVRNVKVIFITAYVVIYLLITYRVTAI